ncbi:MAG: glycosyl hydrolase family 39 [Ferruginibacter sp.]
MRISKDIAAAAIMVLALNLNMQGQELKIYWDNVVSVSKTTPTLQLVENPKVRNSSPIHEPVFKALKDLQANYVRYVPWFPYPKMAVAQLKRPTKTETFWDFTYPDSTMAAFMEATNGHDVVINFSTTPAWMWETTSEVVYPEGAYQTCWNYNQGTKLRDTTMKELSGYFVNLFSWYTRGGFTDELGKFHKSGHYYKIPYWEVLNEPDLEHNISPQLYTKMYDAIVAGIKKISPETKFVGISMARTNNPEYFEYFLNPKNHKPGIKLEGISYHHYSNPSFDGQPLEYYQYTFFEQADCFLERVRYIENIRKRLAPQVFTMVNELGVILRSPEVPGPIDSNYWNLAGAMYAHVFLELTKMGIDVVGESQLVGYPTQFPDVSMVNWENGNPNARYWVLKLLKDNFHPGDKLVKTNLGVPGVVAQGFAGAERKRILLINKKNTRAEVKMPEEFANARISYVDLTTGENPPAKANLTNGIIILGPFAVAVVEI